MKKKKIPKESNLNNVIDHITFVPPTEFTINPKDKFVINTPKKKGPWSMAMYYLQPTDNLTLQLPQTGVIASINVTVTTNTKPVRNKKHWDVVLLGEKKPQVLLQKKRSISGKWK